MRERKPFWSTNDTGSTTTEYTDSDVTPDVRHVYRVKAINAAGLSSWSNFVRVTPTQPAEPARNSPPTGTLTIGGTVQVGETLTADTSGIAATTGCQRFLRLPGIVTDGGDGDITSATDSSYTLGRRRGPGGEGELHRRCGERGVADQRGNG